MRNLFSVVFQNLETLNIYAMAVLHASSATGSSQSLRDGHNSHKFYPWQCSTLSIVRCNGASGTMGFCRKKFWCFDVGLYDVDDFIIRTFRYTWSFCYTKFSLYEVLNFKKLWSCRLVGWENLAVRKLRSKSLNKELYCLIRLKFPKYFPSVKLKIFLGFSVCFSSTDRDNCLPYQNFAIY